MEKDNGLTRNTPNATGVSNIPDNWGEYSKIIWKSKGNKKGIPPKLKRVNKFPSTAIRNVLIFNKVTFIIGFFCYENVWYIQLIARRIKE